MKELEIRADELKVGDRIFMPGGFSPSTKWVKVITITDAYSGRLDIDTDVYSIIKNENDIVRVQRGDP